MSSVSTRIVALGRGGQSELRSGSFVGGLGVVVQKPNIRNLSNVFQ